ncbi:MAG: 3-phosphoshikimate 1-carboxyvinyltransferase [Alloprevotella sp.]|nr:3-phosphoshikimate 1-carboxyvinyltransferase [Alloprevotella sp.]
MQYEPTHNPAPIVRLPLSKSMSNRVLAMEAVAGRSLHEGALSDAEDTRVMEAALASDCPVVDVGDAGTAMRFLTAVLCGRSGHWLLRGSERMAQRPIGPLVDALRQMGATIDYAGAPGFPPLQIDGQALAGGEVDMDGSVSSQFASALLMVAPACEAGLTLHLTGKIASRPYIDLTLSLMRRCGVAADWVDAQTLRVEAGTYCPERPLRIEASWTAASYWYECVALRGCGFGGLTLPLLEADSAQGDRVVPEIFRQFGVQTRFTSEGAHIWCAGDCVKAFAYDCSDCPDLVQTLAATCLAREIPFRLSGLHTLPRKETDRIGALQAVARLFGAQFHREDEGTLTFDGRRSLQADDTHAQALLLPTFNDHRMALAFAPLGLDGWNLRFDRPDVVRKSYPHFWEQLKKTGL